LMPLKLCRSWPLRYRKKDGVDLTFISTFTHKQAKGQVNVCQEVVLMAHRANAAGAKHWLKSISERKQHGHSTP
jgi:hypothetical protein